MNKTKKVTKNQLVEDLQRIIKKYQKEFPESKQSITRDYYRKYGKYNSEYDEIFGSFDNFKNQIKEDIDNIEIEKKIKILTDNVSDLKRDKEKLLKNEIKNEQFLEEFKSKINPISINKHVPKIVQLHREKEIALILSDWHLGETVNAEELGYINSFNKKILFERADEIFEQFHRHCKNIGINKIRVYLLGDLLSGNIHEELRNTNEETVVESMLSLHDYLIQKFYDFGSLYKKTKIICLTGNHPRMTEKAQHKKKALNNFEYILGNMIQHSLKEQKNIEVIVPKSTFVLDSILGKNYLLMHGDGLSSGSGGFGGIAYYALASGAAKLYGALEKANINETRFNSIIIGHLHSFSFIPIFQGGHILINASLIGTGEYALNKIRTVSSIEQSMAVITEEGIESVIRLVPKK
jgi:UDP-2,3-diacylglucosamine pyrophosphatase LpxH